jgi:hypothetical protein
LWPPAQFINVFGDAGMGGIDWFHLTHCSHSIDHAVTLMVVD